MNKFQSVPPLIPGEQVRVIAPSGSLREFEAFAKGVEVWQSRGYQVKLGSQYNIAYGYLAGTDTQRRQVLAEAWQDPNCQAILGARGGYGSARLLENWSWERVPSPKWVIGFSDVTGLLWSLAKEGIESIHGPVLTTLAEEPDWSIQRLFDYLERGLLTPLTGTGWGGGKVTGWLLPGNLTVATHLLGTSVQPSLEGVILALEDVTEAPYRLDRMLTQWRMMGVFEQVKGIALGRFSRCESPPEIPSWTVTEVLRDRLGDLGLPIVSDLPFGHDGANAVLPVGNLVEIDGDTGTVEFL